MMTVVTLKVTFPVEGEADGIAAALEEVENRLRKVAETIGEFTITFATEEK
jgi:hypothetical protein